MTKKILVTGATGYIGGRLVPELLKAGYEVRTLSRNPQKLIRKKWDGIESYQGDALDKESLQAALCGVDVAYYLIHSMTTFGSDFAERDIECARNFAEACQQCGVKRIIYLGGLGSTGPALSKHLQSRHRTGEALASSGVPVTELRAAIVVGSGSASFEIIRDLSSKLPFMVCPKWVYSRCEPISIRQLLAYLVGVVREERTIGETLEVGGGEVLTYASMLRQCAEVLGRNITILPVPVLTPKLSSYWLNLVTSVPMNLCRPLVEGLRNDVVCHDLRIREWIDVPKMPYKEAVTRALTIESGEEGPPTRWTDATTSGAGDPINEDSFHYCDERKSTIMASPAILFQLLSRLGAKNGWFHADWLWRLRALLDWSIGGVGMRRGRRHPTLLSDGDQVDFWRVERVRQNEHICFRAEMKLPGTARLTFDITPVDDESTSELILRAYFWPDSLWGKLYWYAVLPLHTYVFQGMLRRIAERAERAQEILSRSEEDIPSIEEGVSV